MLIHLDMKKILVFIAAIVGAATFSQAQQMPVLPKDPATRVGKLDNGMTYYIRANDKPAQRAEFYLATAVGAIQEGEGQDGLAHFLEHMCFNGTKNFPGKGILNYLESIGASFGGNVNAGTGVEQTIYMLTNIPLVNESVVDSCILIMHDYSHFVLCQPEEIEAERGVILEEKRSRDTANWRMHLASNKYIYGDTPYGSNTLIGSEETLKTFKPEKLTDFYHTWYRPDNQALIVVGDINVDEVEAKIKSIFADIPAPVNPKAKDKIVIPENEEPIVGVITDPECTGTSVEVIWKSEPTPKEYNNTSVGFTTDILKSIIALVMDERFSDIAAKSDAPFINASLGIGKMAEPLEVVMLSAACKDGESLKALEALMTEAEKMKRFGFTDAEIERAKSSILASFESEEKRAESRKNPEFVNPIINNFLENKAFMDPATEHQLAQMVLSQLNSQVINQVAQTIITPANMVVLVEAPEKEGLVNPGEAEVTAVIKKVQSAEIENVAAEEVPAEFLDPSTLKAGKFKGAAKDYIYGSELYTLKNGVQVILYPTDIQKNQIAIDIYKKGGQSLISDEDLYSFDANIWALFVQNSGIASFPQTTSQKMLAGKDLSVTPYINGYTHGVQVRSTPKDLETALQLANLYFTDPRFDQSEYDQGETQIKAILPNLKEQSNYKLQEQLFKTVYDSPRRFMISEEVLEKANLETIERVYKGMFSDINGATVVVVGDFDKNEMLPLIQKYVGSINKGGKPAGWKYCSDGFVTKNIVNDFKAKMQTPMVTVGQFYTIAKPYTVADEVNNEALAYILGMIYTTTLREDEGGTYGASVVGQTGTEPDETQIIQVMFQTNTEQADKLRELAVKGMKEVAAEGPTKEDFDKTVNNLNKNIPESKLRTAYWLSAIEKYQKFGFNYIEEYEAAVKALTPEKIQAYAAELLDSGNFIEVIMRPEE